MSTVYFDWKRICDEVGPITCRRLQVIAKADPLKALMALKRIRTGQAETKQNTHTMTATLTFTLPDEQIGFTRAAHAAEMAIVISELAEEARGWVKYGHNFKSVEEVAEYVRTRLAEVRGVAEGGL